jgi:hypothetical protein
MSVIAIVISVTVIVLVVQTDNWVSNCSGKSNVLKDRYLNTEEDRDTSDMQLLLRTATPR